MEADVSEEAIESYGERFQAHLELLNSFPLGAVTEGREPYLSDRSGSLGPSPQTAVKWTAPEKGAFFGSLARHSRWRTDLIASEIGTKSETQVVWYLQCLESGSKANLRQRQSSNAERRSGGWLCGMAPAAVEMPEQWIANEESLASALSVRHDRYQATMKQADRDKRIADLLRFSQPKADRVRVDAVGTKRKAREAERLKILDERKADYSKRLKEAKEVALSWNIQDHLSNLTKERVEYIGTLQLGERCREGPSGDALVGDTIMLDNSNHVPGSTTTAEPDFDAAPEVIAAVEGTPIIRPTPRDNVNAFNAEEEDRVTRTTVVQKANVATDNDARKERLAAEEDKRRAFEAILIASGRAGLSKEEMKDLRRLDRVARRRERSSYFKAVDQGEQVSPPLTVSDVSHQRKKDRLAILEAKNLHERDELDDAELKDLQEVTRLRREVQLRDLRPEPGEANPADAPGLSKPERKSILRGQRIEVLAAKRMREEVGLTNEEVVELMDLLRKAKERERRVEKKQEEKAKREAEPVKESSGLPVETAVTAEVSNVADKMSAATARKAKKWKRLVIPLPPEPSRTTPPAAVDAHKEEDTKAREVAAMDCKAGVRLVQIRQMAIYDPKDRDR